MAQQPGITVRHVTLPQRRYGLVRCDISAVLGFIPAARWPIDAEAGDFVELTLKRTADFIDHPLRGLFDPVTRRAVRAFFDNGGAQVQLYGLCIDSEADLQRASDPMGPFRDLFQRLEGDEDISLLACPAAAYLPCHMSREGRVTCDADGIYDAMLEHCKRMENRFAVLDAPRGLHAEALLAWVAQFRDRYPETRAFGAVYYPWLCVGTETMPPSGAILGVYARTEREHEPYGVSWPPANVPVRGITHPEVDLTWDEVGEIASAACNPLVVQPGRGVLVFGARTLSRDSRWEFINSRRVVSMIGEQLRRDNEWVVFEQNDRMIWKVLERDVTARLDEFWEQGMLTGGSAGSDYMVRCDEETNTQLDRDAGRLNVEVRLRPVSTTEHITIELRLGDGE